MRKLDPAIYSVVVKSIRNIIIHPKGWSFEMMDAVLRHSLIVTFCPINELEILLKEVFPEKEWNLENPGNAMYFGCGTMGVIWFQPDWSPDKFSDLALATHEFTHANHNMGTHSGIPFKDDSEEWYCYRIQWQFECLIAAFQMKAERSWKKYGIVKMTLQKMGGTIKI